MTAQTQKRLGAMQRVLAVQEQLRRLAESKLADLERREAKLQAARRELVEALNGDQALHGLFVEAMARRVTALSKAIVEIGRLKEEQAKRLREETGRQKRAERITEGLDRDLAAALDRQSLAELIERLPPGSGLAGDDR